MWFSKEDREIKEMENQQKAQEQLAQLTSALKSVDKMIEEFYADGQDRLMHNDEEGFQLIANSIFYFQDIQKILSTVKIQFQTYFKTSQFMGTIEGIRPILKNTAKIMSSYPSIKKNNRDFIKFKRGLMRGQLNMKAMSSMMKSINPAASQTRTTAEMDALKERMMAGQNADFKENLATNTTAAPVQQAQTNNNDDFFNMINGD